MSNWFWKKSVHGKNDDHASWQAYDKNIDKQIEDAWQEKKRIVKISDNYSVDLMNMVQFQNQDKSKQRSIKRIGQKQKSKDADEEKPKKKQKTEKKEAEEEEVEDEKRDLRLRSKPARSVLHDLTKDPASLRALTCSSKKKNKKNNKNKNNKKLTIDDFTDDEDEDGELPNEKLVSHFLDALPASAIKPPLQYGDLVDFDGYRGVGLYVVGVRKGKLTLLKTRGEYGYCLPKEMLAIPRTYFVGVHYAIDSGFDLLDQEGFYESD